MFNLIDKKIIAILRKLFSLNWPYEFHSENEKKKMVVLNMNNNATDHPLHSHSLVSAFVINFL